MREKSAKEVWFPNPKKVKREKEKQLTVWKIPAVPDQKSIERSNKSLLERASNYAITSEDHYTASWVLVGQLDGAMKIIEDAFSPFISGLHKLHKMAIALRDGFYDPLYAAKEKLMADRYGYREQQEKIKADAEAKLAAGLQKQRQKELEKQARAAERRGEKDVAAVLWDHAEAVPLPVLKSEPAVPKQEGSIIRERWIYTIVDPSAVEREYCSPDDKLIRPVVEALGPACKISGLKIEREKKEHSRAVNE